MEAITIFVALAFLLHSVLGAGECPSGWQFDPQTSLCYLVSQRFFSNGDAAAYCSSQGGLLTLWGASTRAAVLQVSSAIVIAILNSTNEATLHGLTSSQVVPAWTCASLNPSNNRWQWTDGTFFSSQFWTAGEPSSAGSCAVFRSLDPVGIKAAPCYSLQPAMCRIQPNLCNGGSFTGYNGTLSSPGYPVEYYNNLDCIYLITGQNPNSFITITFDPFFVEATYDYVTIYDGNTTSGAKQIARFSSTSNGKNTFESSSNQMTVVFHTDKTGTDKGWTANWTAKPNYPPIAQSGSNGEMTSPNYPANYDPFTEQNYSIQANSKVSMTFDSFTTEVNYDTLLIFDSSNLIANLSGILPTPLSVQSVGSSISMIFSSDGQVQMKGWHMTWTAI